MIGQCKFKAPFSPRERIWQEADRIRAAHPAGRSIPVQILDLAEFDLSLELIPVDGLREQLDIDALLVGDLRSILLDKRTFMSPRLEYRLRFSVAHEIGHLILHRDIYAGLQHATAKEWSDKIWLRVRGHDVIDLLGFALRKALGSWKAQDATREHIERGLRLAYPEDAFSETFLLRQVRDWETANPPYRVFREIRQKTLGLEDEYTRSKERE